MIAGLHVDIIIILPKGKTHECTGQIAHDK